MGRKVSALHLDNQGCAVLNPWLGGGKIVFLGRYAQIKNCPLCTRLVGPKEGLWAPQLRGSRPFERKWIVKCSLGLVG